MGKERVPTDPSGSKKDSGDKHYLDGEFSQEYGNIPLINEIGSSLYRAFSSSLVDHPDTVSSGLIADLRVKGLLNITYRQLSYIFDNDNFVAWLTEKIMQNKSLIDWKIIDTSLDIGSSKEEIRMFVQEKIAAIGHSLRAMESNETQ